MIIPKPACSEWADVISAITYYNIRIVTRLLNWCIDLASKPLTVLFLIDSFRMGGAERITVALLPHLDRQRVKPLVATITTRRESPLGRQLGDVPKFDIEASRLLDPAALRRLIRLIQTQQVDLIHAQLQDATLFAVATRPFVRKPIVITRHLIGDDAYNWRRRWRSRLEGEAVKRGVDKIISVSNAARDHYAQSLGIPLSRFETIYNGIDLARFAPQGDKRDLRQRLGLPQDRFIILMVGVMRPGKGQEVAIAAVKDLPDDALLLLVGDGKAPYPDQLKAQAQGLEQRVQFLGQRLDIPDLLNAADLFILPSDSEALPTVLIEAGAAGLPVVATHVGGVPEVIQDGATGILIPPQNPGALSQAIYQLHQSPERCQQMGKAAFEYVNSLFGLPQQAENTTRLYEQLTGIVS